jgi:hypothetical protein
MSVGLLASLLKLPGRSRPRSRFSKTTSLSRRPFLESLENRTLPSIASPKLADTPGLPVSGLADNSGLLNDLGNHRDDQHPGQNNGPSNGPQDGQDGENKTQVYVGVETQLDVQLDLLEALNLNPYGDGRDNKPQGQDNNGQTNGPVDNQGPQGVNQGDGQGGPSDSSDNGQGNDQTNIQGDSQGDQEVSPGDGQGGPSDGSGPGSQGDSSDNGQGNGQGLVQGNSSDNGSTHGTGCGTNVPSEHAGRTLHGPCARTNNDPPNGQDDKPNAAADIGPDAGSDNGPAGPSIGTADGINAPANGQGSALDRKQHGSGSGAVSEGEHRGAVSGSDAKQHTPDGTAIPGEELHNLVSAGNPEPEQSNRNQAAAPGPLPSGPMEEPVPRQVEERVSLVEALQRSAAEENPYPPAREVFASLVYELPEHTVRDQDYPNGSPQKHGLLTDSLSLDLASLRAEVQSFFDLMDHLGGPATERQISVLLSSGAVVVAAAMACEVARRQARRPASGSTFALVPNVKFGGEADTPSGIGLPNFGQFSAFS